MRVQVFVLPLCLAATAAGQGLPIFPASLHTKTWPSQGGTVTLSVTGLLSGNGYPDVVTVRGGTPYLFYSPALHSSVTAVPGVAHVTGMAVTRPGPTPLRHRLLLADAAGLHAFTDQPEIGPVTQSLGFPSWRSARNLRVVDLDGDGWEDVLGIDAAGRIRLLFGSAGGLGNEVVLSGVSVSALTTLNRGAGLQVAFAAAGKLYLTDASLTIGESAGCLPAGTVVSMVAVRTAAAADLLATVVADGAGSASLHLLDADVESVVVLPGHDVVGMAAGDIDADQDDDLCFSQRNNHRALLLVHRPGYRFDYNAGDALEVELLPIGSSAPAPGNAATPLLVDLEADGDTDLYHPVQSNDSIAIAFSPFRDPFFTGIRPDGGLLDDLGPYINVELDLIAGVALPADATDVQVVVWELTENAGQWVVSGPPTSATIQPLPIWTISFDLPASLAEHPVYMMMVRPVSTVGGAVTRAFAPWVGAIYTDESAEGSLIATGGSAPTAMGYKDGGQGTGGYVGFPLPPPPPGGEEGEG